MSTLYLHVGHGKTGSSYIQSALASSETGLRARNLIYPRHGSHERALAGAISSGNGGLLFDRAWSPAKEHGGCDWLFSDENLFQRLITPSFVEQLEARKRELAVSQVSILLFIRDPLDHACSGYQQTIKRGGKTWSVDEFFENYHLPRRVRRFMDDYAQAGVSLHVRNYSRCRSHLLAEVESWLQCAPLIEPPTPVVNRSLTRAELAFQRSLNAQLEGGAHFVADALCEKLPEIQAEPVRPSMAAQKALLARLNDAIVAVNERLPESQRYATELLPDQTPDNDSLLNLSVEQIDVIAAALGGKIAALKSTKPGLRNLLR